MDISAWKKFSSEGSGKAIDVLPSRQARLSPEQRKAVWSWHAPDADKQFESATSGALAGVPFAAKDLFHVKGVPTMAGGRLAQRPARRTSRMIARLKSAGAVLTGKTQLHEFAYGLTGENPHYGNIEHPHHVGRSSGGSSSGSAAVVAAGIVPFALGTDTAGSLRVPAAYCGLFSWRGQPGESWISDAFPLAPAFDTAGWLCSTASDCSALWRTFYTPEAEATHPARGAYLPATSLGLTGTPPHEHALNTRARALAETVLESDHPLALSCRDVAETYSILQSTEAYAVHQANLDRHRANYGEVVWSRIDRGRHWTAGQLDQARLHALRIRSAFDVYFDNYDFLVTPISLEPAPRYHDESPALRDNLLNLNTHISIAGRPAVSIPVDIGDDLTLGLQIVFSHSTSFAIPTVLDRCGTC